MHTRMVCAELERLADWPLLDRTAQLKLLFTALFHDSGKPGTTATIQDLQHAHSAGGTEVGIVEKGADPGRTLNQRK